MEMKSERLGGGVNVDKWERLITEVGWYCGVRGARVAGCKSRDGEGGV